MTLISPEDPSRAPRRIQLKRTKGWRKAKGAVIVARPSQWGNPFKVVYHRATFPAYTVELRGIVYESAGSKRRASELAADLFDLHVGVMGSIEYDDEKLTLLRRNLGGHDLACWCPLDRRCHADTLLELANAAGGSGV